MESSDIDQYSYLMNIDGRTAQVNALLEAQFPAVWSYLYANTGDPVAADDLSREAFAQVAVCFVETCRCTIASIPLVYITARRLWRDRRRSLPETPHIILRGREDDSATIDSLTTENGHDTTAILTDHLWQRVLKLPRSQRESVLLRQRGGLAFGDIASIVHCRESTARSRYRKGIRRLFKSLQGDAYTDHQELEMKLKALPTKVPTDEDRLSVLKKLNAPPSVQLEAALPHRQGLLFRRAAAIGCSVVLVVATSTWLLVHLRTKARTPLHPQWPVYPIAVAPTSVTPTPLDTTEFRNTARQYLERHSLSSAGNPYLTPARLAGSNRVVNHAVLVHNHVSELAVRWSRITFGRYGYAVVTFIGNGQPRTVDIVALKPGPVWSIAETDFAPVLPAKALSTAALDVSEVNGTLLYLGDDAAFQFVSGLVVDPAVTQVTITTTNGQNATAPVINGVFGFEVTDLTGKLIRGADYTIQAYDRQGVLVYTH